MVLLSLTLNPCSALDIHMWKKKKKNPNVGPIQPLLKWILALNINLKTKKLLEKHISKNGGLTLGKDFLYLTSKK